MKIIATRHGESLHNVNSKLWEEFRLCDAMGLTENGVRQSFRKAEALLPEARNYDEVVLTHSPTIRATQTASILGKYLRQQGIRVESTPVFYLTEVPDLSNREFPSGWEYSRFTTDPTYSVDNSESILDRIKMWWDNPWLPQQGRLQLIVSHKYAILSMLTARSFQKKEMPSDDEFVARFKELYRDISHDELITL